MFRPLRWLVGRDLADSIVGDLVEARDVRARRSRLRAALWFWMAIAAVMAHALRSRFSDMTRALTRSVLPGAGFWQDTSYAIRALRRTPGYAATVIGVLALGLTLATTVFAVVDGVLLKPLPYPRADELMSIEPGRKSHPELLGALSASPSVVAAWTAAAPDVPIAFVSIGGREQIDDGEPARSAGISRTFFEVLGQRPVVGGFLTEHFSAKGPVTPVIITHASWHRRFGGDKAVLGRTIRGDWGAVAEIVGILPPEFLWPSSLGRLAPEVLTPLVDGPAGGGLLVSARVPPSLPIAALQARLSAATAELAARTPARPGAHGPGPFDMVRVRPMDDALRSASRQTFSIVFALSAALVLLSCLNVTGLAAARVQDRHRELALRRALGAGGANLVRLLGTESLVIVVVSAALGVSAAWLLLPVISAFLPDSLVLLKPLAIDVRVVAFAAAAAAACVAVTTTWPARVTLVTSLRPALSEGGATTRRRHSLGRRVLVGAQVAMALTIAIGGTLLVGSWIRVWQEDPGYRVGNVAHLWLSERESTPWPVIERLIEDVRRTPGVADAGGSNLWLLQRAVRGSSFTAPPGAIVESDVESVGVTPGFLEIAALRPTSGRWPTVAELATGAPVVLVSERVARDYWRGLPAVGQTLTREGRAFDVIGVVPDARYLALDRDPDGTVYYPLSADANPSIFSMFVAFTAPESKPLPAVLALMKEHYPQFRVRRAQPLTTTLGDSVRQRSFHAMLFGAFGVAAIVIVGVGVFGLAVIITSRRTREVGLRMALGARPSEIAGLVVRQELAAVAAGLLVGGLITAWAAGLVRSYLYEMSPHDPWVWAAAIVLVSATTVLGVLIPALRASRVDPVTALRID